MARWTLFGWKKPKGGGSDVDLSDYYNKEDVDAKNGSQDAVIASNQSRIIVLEKDLKNKYYTKTEIDNQYSELNNKIIDFKNVSLQTTEELDVAGKNLEFPLGDIYFISVSLRNSSDSIIVNHTYTFTNNSDGDYTTYYNYLSRSSTYGVKYTANTNGLRLRITPYQPIINAFINVTVTSLKVGN